MPVDLLVCVATPLEAEPVAERLEARRGPPGFGTALLVTGVGPVNAAHALTRFLSRERPRMVLSCGVGGAYPSSGLGIGAAVAAISDTWGDLGADSPGGFLDMEALGFPVLERAGEAPLFNRLPASLVPLERRAPFVTVSTCTGTDARAREIEERTQGAVESMEGAAILQVALAMGVPAGEIRGISNRAGDRDRSKWRVAKAARAAADALVRWIEEGAG